MWIHKFCPHSCKNFIISILNKRQLSRIKHHTHLAKTNSVFHDNVYNIFFIGNFLSMTHSSHTSLSTSPKFGVLYTYIIILKEKFFIASGTLPRNLENRRIFQVIVSSIRINELRRKWKMSNINLAQLVATKISKQQRIWRVRH